MFPDNLENNNNPEPIKKDEIFDDQQEIELYIPSKTLEQLLKEEDQEPEEGDESKKIYPETILGDEDIVDLEEEDDGY